MPTFLTEPQWYDENGVLTTTENVKVNSADSANVAERATDYFGKKYQCPDWMKFPIWLDANNGKMTDGSLLLSGNEIQKGDDYGETAYLEVLPAVLQYGIETSETGRQAVVNLGNNKRKFGKIYAESFYAESFEGPASHVSIYNQSKLATNSYKLSLDGTTLTFTKI